MSEREEGAGGGDAREAFVAMTGCDPQQAGFLLEAAGGDLDAAVQLYLGVFHEFWNPRNVHAILLMKN
eukprot:895700-Pelagomonas_calceolata.AAC.1